jgi:cell wall-associated NlpC family hydrolase
MEEDADSYHIAIPARNAEGHVVEYIGRAAKKASPVSQIGPLLAPTRASLAQSAFELLGERYAWGDSRLGQFGRDCSRLVKDVYASIGITLARNADEQEATLPLAPQQDLQTLQLGDLLFIPGHVMLGLGVVEGIPYVLHAFGRGYKAVVVTSTAPPQAENLMAKRWALCRFGGAQ